MHLCFYSNSSKHIIKDFRAVLHIRILSSALFLKLMGDSRWLETLHQHLLDIHCLYRSGRCDCFYSCSVSCCRTSHPLTLVVLHSDGMFALNYTWTLRYLRLDQNKSNYVISFLGCLKLFLQSRILRCCFVFSDHFWAEEALFTYKNTPKALRYVTVPTLPGDGFHSVFKEPRFLSFFHKPKQLLLPGFEYS